MANVIGSGKDRHLVDSDGDALDDGAGKLNVNATLVAGATIDIGDVDIFLDGGTALLGGSGAVAAGVLRTTLASDDPAVAHLSTIASNTTATRSGTSTLVDSVHLDDAPFTLGSDSGIMMMGFAGTQSVGTNDSGAIAMETDGSIHVHDGGNSITVDGTVTADLSATDNAVLDAIDTVLDTIKVDTEAIETAVEAIQVDAAAIETLLTAANVDHAANEALLTTIDSDTDNIKMGVQLAVTDLAAIEVLLTTANVDYADIEALLTTIDADTGAAAILQGAMVVDLAAIEVLLTSANVDHAANEALLITIDADTNAIKGYVDGIETLITSTNSKIDTFDAVLDNILTKNTEIDAVLDTIKVDTEAIETAVELLDNAIDGNEMQVDIVSSSTITVDGTVTANLGSTDNAVLDAMVVDLAAIEVLLTASNVDHAANEALLTTIDADTNSIKTAVEIIDNAISGNEMQVDVITMPSITVDSELPAAATSADNFSNPSTTNIMSMGMVYDGSTWDRARGDSSNGLLVNLGSNNDVAVTGTVTANLSSTDNAVLDAMVVDLAAIEVLLTSANTDHAANEVLLTAIDAVLDTIKVDTEAIETAVELLDNAIDGSEMQVDIVSAPTITVDGTVAVTHAALTELGTAINASDQMDVNIASGGFDGAVTNTGLTNLDAAIGTDGATGPAKAMSIAGTNSGNLQEIAVDASGNVQVDVLSAPTTTVTGTITANLSATDNAVLDAIDTVLDTIKVDTEAIETAVEAIQVDADAIETLLTAANVDHAANEALLITIDADTNSIKTAVEILDNAIDGNEMQVDIVSSATITVDGTVTANLSATDNAVLDAMVVDLAAMEALLITIDSDTNNLKTAAGAIATAVELLDNAVDGNYLNTNLNIAGTDVDGDSGNKSAQSQRVVIATDDIPIALVNTNLAHLSDNLDTLETTNNAMQVLLGTIDSDTDAIKTAVEGTITVDGTVTANLSATDNAVLDAMVVDLAAMEALLITIDSDTNNIKLSSSDIKDATENSESDIGAIKTAVQILDNAISGSEMQVDVVAALPAGSNAIGKLAANSGVDIGDVDITSIAAGTNIIGKVGHNITGGGDGLKVVATAGTDLALGGDVDCKKIDIQAQTDNTGIIAIGFTGVDATEATGTGIVLYAGDTYSLEVTNLNLIYIDATVSGEGVRYTYYT